MRNIFEYINEANSTFEVDINMSKKDLDNFINSAKRNDFDITMSRNKYADVAVIKGDKKKIKDFLHKNGITDMEYSEK